MQNVSNLVIPEGNVRTIHDKDNRLIWGRLAYDTKYAGNTLQNGTPTPDAPVAVQTATGEQTVWVHGKNMFNPALLSQVEGYNTYNSATGLWTTSNLGSYYRSIFYDAASSGSNRDVSKIVGPLTANTTYAVKLYDFVNNTGTTSRPLSYALFHSNNTVIAGSNVRVESFFTFTTPDEACYLDIRRLESGGTVSFSKIMIIEGTYTEQTMPSYEPYQSQSYTVNLGSTEFCKIGGYQDYIYKSGDDWYVHKATNKYTFTGSETIGKASNTSNNSYYYASSQNPDYGFSDIDRTHMTSGSGSTAVIPIYSKYFGESSSNTIVSTDSIGIGFNLSGASGIDCRIGVGLSSSINTAALLKTWLTNNTLSVYYPLATPTDTEITDTNLITQLNNIHQFLTRYGYNSNVSGNLPIIIDKTDLS